MPQDALTEGCHLTTIKEMLGCCVEVVIAHQWTLVRLVDAEEHFSEPGVGSGFVHFADPKTGKKLGYCGISCALKNMRFVKAK